MKLEVDLSWLLMTAEQYTPGDPQVTDYGSLLAAIARHHAEIFDIAVYPEPQDRAAALMHQLIRVPALERTNELFATAVAYAYLVASGCHVATTAREVRSLARAIREGKLGIDGVAERLNGWIVDEAEGEGVAGEEGPEDSD
ncbi:fic family toxin-antitoxin system, toxin component [Streptomyces tateyamensis]|uniref:Fic family toxin-antitoxin system, toxin component n=1 Tax=Streptomyces tateyamensis TaxID=565073 RepID=A0A2V4P2R1_9ACTN|nr:fic family toxin-antitoxin system, toxin component [Streptomyces tateyamensis]PYC77037.1 fic family toxin-antitoxin system, toxin component [Streptomyces tateyamensis]